MKNIGRLIAAIGLIALVLAGVHVVQRYWHLRQRCEYHRQLAWQHAAAGRAWGATSVNIGGQELPVRHGDFMLPALGRLADLRAAGVARKEQELAAYHAGLEQKYRTAMARPWLRMGTD